MKISHHMYLPVDVHSESSVITVAISSLTIVIAYNDDDEHLYEASWKFGVVRDLVKKKE